MLCPRRAPPAAPLDNNTVAVGNLELLQAGLEIGELTAEVDDLLL